MALREPEGASIEHVAELWGTAWHKGRELAIEEWPLARALRGETVPKMQLRMVQRNGHIHNVVVNASAIRDDTGKIVAAAAVLSNLAERRRTEAVLTRACHDAEQASLAKTRVLAAASHDLRQPLQAGMLLQRVLAQRNRDPDLNDIIRQLGQSLDAQQEMLDTLLDISKLDAGIMTVKLGHFSIRDLLDRLAMEFLPQFESCGLRFCMVKSSVWVASDQRLLGRILRNLLSNAMKYTRRGRVLMGCRVSGTTVRIQVWDTGIGMTPQQLTVIFEEFRQLEGEPLSQRKGLGLGLAIVDRLARLLGHTISVHSEPGRGSMFEILVPLARMAAEPANAPRVAVPRGRVIALLDDDPDVLEALRLTIECAGYRAIAAAEVSEIEALLRRQGRAPDLILADYRLHGDRTGVDAILALRQAFDAPIPGILLTGDTSAERLKEARTGSFQLLHKPVKPDELIRAIGQWL